MMFGEEPEEEYVERPQPSRPVSWHPTSTHFQARGSTYFEPQQYTTSSRNSSQGSDFYSLSTRNSMFEPSAQSANSGIYGMNRGSDEYENSWQGLPQQTTPYTHSAVNTPLTEPLPWYLQQWAQKNEEQSGMASHYGSTDFLPIQHPAQQDEEMQDDSGEKLVALGLYDLPESSSSWSGFEPATGIGLKLEETWQPPEEDEDDDEDVDDASSEASEEPSPPLPAVHDHTQQLQLPVHVKSQTPGSMEGQSFFFDDEETVSKEWWFQQMKQSTMPMRDNGLGYGWL
jgi:hypothetical protein